MKRLLVLFLLIAAPALAQPEVVAQVKAELQARGVNLSDSCGAFQITERVAWRLRSTGAGLLSKPSGNNCQGYAVDIIAYADGRIFDILSDAGGANGPTWGASDPVDPSRWRAAFDPGDSPAPPPVPVPQPPVFTDLSGIYSRLDALSAALGVPPGDSLHAQAQRIFGEAEAVAAEQRATHATIEEKVDNPGWFKQVFGSRYTQIALSAAAAWFTAHQAAK